MATAAEKAHLAKLEQEVVTLRTQLDTATTTNARIVEEAKAKEARDEESIRHLVEDRRKGDEDLATAKRENEHLTTANEQLRHDLANTEADVRELNGHLTRLASPNAEQERDVLEHDGRRFRVLVPGFHFKGTDYTADEVTTGSQILEQLVAVDAQILQELEPELEPAE
jgi:chromosome segregation ATPase